MAKGATVSDDVAESAGRKLEEFFGTLDEEEREVLGEMIRNALLYAADQYEPRIPRFVEGITGQSAPSVVKSLRLPGSLAAHSIPGCNASALIELKAL